MDKRKELKQLYKESPLNMGVYQIRNLQNGKVMIGKSTDLNGIKNRHFFSLKMGNHPNAELLQDYRALGADAFVFEVLEKTKEHEELAGLEEIWIEKLQPYGEHGYHKETKSKQD